ncbi:MAG: VWA domain-containing protein [Spirochaetia bacterium]|nr:VWA domain-containing protein [Spirochaetia bacterium]
MKRFSIITSMCLIVAWALLSCASVDGEYESGSAMESEAKTAAGSKPSGTRADVMPSPAPSMKEAWESEPSAMGTMAPRSTPGSSGLKAGFSDDNAGFGYFVDFLKKYEGVPHFAYDISERLTLSVLDVEDKPVANAGIVVAASGRTLIEGKTYADGTYRLYPAALDSKVLEYEVRVGSGTQSQVLRVKRDGPRRVDIRLGAQRSIPSPMPLDVLFVMDTTGSMGEEIQRLKSTIEIIYANLTELKPRPRVRFGLVLYKDTGDEYVTQISPFTEDLDAFQERLELVTADGGGDGPEDLESALDDAVNAMDWNDDGLRLAFIVTDAEAHLDYGRPYTYIHAANDARAKAIKLYTIGTGGLPLAGEYLLRQVSQLTSARYIFLTYGERGESDGGSEGSVSHHSGTNFQTDKLEAIIIRFVKEEVALMSDTPLVSDDDYFSAKKVIDESREQTFDALFAEAIGSLADYSSFHIDKDTTVAVLPVSVSGEALRANAEYFGERLMMASVKASRWKPVERKDLQKILSELELSLSGIVDEKQASKVGELLGAELLVVSTLYERADRFELLMRLLRVSTAEVLSVSRARIEKELGL